MKTIIIILLMIVSLIGKGQHHMMYVLSQTPVNTGVPTYQSSATLTGSAAGVAAGGTFTVACPETVNQYDILIASVQTGGATGAVTIPVGWSLMSSVSNVLHSRVICWKRASGAEDGTNISFTTTNAITTTNGYSGVVYRFSGCTNSGTPYTGLANYGVGSVSSLPIPEVTVSTNELAVVLYLQKDNVSITTTGGSSAQWTIQDNQSTALGLDYLHAAITTNTTGVLTTWNINTGSSKYVGYYLFKLIP